MKITEIYFAGGHYWPIGIVIFAIAYLVLKKWYWTQQLVSLLNPVKSRISLIHNYTKARSLIKACLWILGFCFIWFALLQPQWGKKEEKIQQEGRDIVIALDVSRSMLAQDCAPNRLEFAKEKVKRLLRALACERVGLLLFSGSAVVQCPLTNDYNAFLLFLNQLDAQTISSGTTALDQALAKAINLFDKNHDRKNKIIVAFTDGEDFSSNLAAVKQQAIAAGLQIFTIGVGTVQGAPIPIIDQRGEQKDYQRDAQGTIVISRLNEGILQALAQESGGTYIKARLDDSDINAIVERVQKFEREKFDDKVITSFYDRYHYSIAAAFFCFLIEWLL